MFIFFFFFFFFFSSRRRHTRSKRDWSSDVCSSDLNGSELSKAVLMAASSGAISFATFGKDRARVLFPVPLSLTATFPAVPGVSNRGTAVERFVVPFSHSIYLAPP